LSTEQGITNIEVRYSIICILEKRLSAVIPHFIISASGGFAILRFAVPTMSSFIQCVRMNQLGSLTPET
jgi:hypothetical protein